MNKERKQYDEEFKKRAVRLSYDPARTVQSVIDDLGISNSMLYRWRRTYSEAGEKTEESIQIEEVRRLRKRIAELEEENEILKKASAYFAKHQR
jgi:transposase